MDERTTKRAKFLIDAAYFFVIALLVYITFKYIAGWLLPFIVAFGIVTVVHPVIRHIKKWLNIKQAAASILVMVLIYAAVGVLIFLLIMQIVLWIKDALALLPGYFETTIRPTIDTIGASFLGFVERLPEQWQEQLAAAQTEIIGTLQSFLIGLSQSGVSALKGLTSSVPSFMIGLLFTIMLSFFISMQYDRVTAFIKEQLPPRAKKILSDTRLIMIDTVIRYLRAALTLMAITFVELATGLLILRQKNAIPIAVGIAIFDALPFFGTGAIVIPWALIELIQMNFSFAIGLIILYAIIVLVRNIIEPKIVSDRLGLNPIVSLVSIYLGFKVFGVLGMVFMPIITQILLALHKNGSIRIFKAAVDSAPQENTESPPQAPPRESQPE